MKKKQEEPEEVLSTKKGRNTLYARKEEKVNTGTAPLSERCVLVGDWEYEINASGNYVICRTRFTGRGRKPKDVNEIMIVTLAKTVHEALQWLPRKRDRKYLRYNPIIQIPIIFKEVH